MKRTAPLWVVALLSLALVVSAGVLVLQHAALSRSAAEVERLAADVSEARVSGYNDGVLAARQELMEARQELAAAQEELAAISPEYHFYHTWAVIVTSTGKKWHHYGCPHISGLPFYLYNVDLAEADGYEPCLDCWDYKLQGLPYLGLGG